MATVRKIDSISFFVNWASARDTVSSQIEVKLSNATRMCMLSYSIKPPNLNVRVDLQLEKSEELTLDLESTMILVSKYGEHQMMTFENSAWETSFPAVNRCCGRGLVLDFVIIFRFKYNPLTDGDERLDIRMENLWKNKNFSDVTFQCKGKSISAHAAIVASGSPVMAAMFQHNFRENTERIVEITDMEPSTLEQLLYATYTGDMEFDDVDVTALLIAADKYAMEPLKALCAEYLSVSISAENVMQYLIFSHVYNIPNLRQSANKFIAKHAKEISSREDWMNLIKNYPELGIAAVQSMASEWSKNT